MITAADFLKWCYIFRVDIGGGSGGGNVVNNTGSTDMAVPRFVGTSGKVIEDSPVTISDLGLLTAPGVTANVANIQGSLIFQGATDGSSIPYAMSINNFTGSQWVWGQEVSSAEWRIAQSIDLTTNVVARFDHATLAAQFASIQNTPIGTAVANTGDFSDLTASTFTLNNHTLTLGGNTAFSGAFSFTGMLTANTSVTYPTSGTLATTTDLAGYLPLTGGTLTGNLSLSASQSSGLDLTVNNSSTSAGAYARLFLQTLQASGSDPYVTFLLAGSPNVAFSIGLDNTDDNFKMTRGFALGTADFAVNTTTGVVTLGSPLPLSSGGTNANLTASAGGVAYSTASAIAFSAVGSEGQLLQSTGSGAPVWTTATYPTTAGIASTFLRSNGTNIVNSTTTYPDTNAINTIQYASSANVMGSISAANNGVLQTSATGVPSLSTTQTYTPTIGDGTNNFTTSSASGWYYRVGARTFVNINISWTGKGSASGTVRISLPGTSASAPGANCFSIGYISGVTSVSTPLAFCNGTDNYIQLINFVSGGAGTSIAASSFATSGQLQFAGWFGS